MRLRDAVVVGCYGLGWALALLQLSNPWLVIPLFVIAALGAGLLGAMSADAEYAP